MTIEKEALKMNEALINLIGTAVLTAGAPTNGTPLDELKELCFTIKRQATQAEAAAEMWMAQEVLTTANFSRSADGIEINGKIGAIHDLGAAINCYTEIMSEEQAVALKNAAKSLVWSVSTLNANDDISVVEA